MNGKETTKIKFQPVLPKKKSKKILSANPGEIAIDEHTAKKIAFWHDVKNAKLNRSVLTGTLEGIEPHAGMSYCYTRFKEHVVTIPINAMGFHLEDEENMDKGQIVYEKSKIANSMLGAEIDFIIEGYDEENDLVIASRENAMIQKTKMFYDTCEGNESVLVYEGTRLRARVVSVTKKRIRVELLGVATTLSTNKMSKLYISDAREMYQVGGKVDVIVEDVEYPDLIDGVNYDASKNYKWDEFYQGIKVTCSLLSMQYEDIEADYKKAQEQGVYTATVTDVHPNQWFLRVHAGNTGVNGIAHSCVADSIPFAGDTVKFLCQKKKDAKMVLNGTITKVINSKL